MNRKKVKIMAIAKITMIGFYNYLAHDNEDLFEYLSVPEGIDKDTLVNNILLRGGEFEVLYSDPNFFKNMIGVWSNKWQRTMQRWINALSIDYNPLENYDRMEDWEDNGSKVSAESRKNDASAQRTNVSQNSVTDAKTNSDNTVNSDKQERSENAIAHDDSTSTGDGTTTNTRSAYESPGYQPHDKSESVTNGTNVSNGITSANGTTTNNAVTSTQGSANGTTNALNQTMGTDAETGSQTANAVDKTNGVHSGRIHGNIGVTTSQAMLQAELDISKWNIYEEITNLFLNEFCIYLY